MKLWFHERVYGDISLRRHPALLSTFHFVYRPSGPLQHVPAPLSGTSCRSKYLSSRCHISRRRAIALRTIQVPPYSAPFGAAPRLSYLPNRLCCTACRTHIVPHLSEAPFYSQKWPLTPKKAENLLRRQVKFPFARSLTLLAWLALLFDLLGLLGRIG